MLANPITFSLCSKLVSYCVQLSSTQHPSSSPSAMVSRLTQSPSHTSHASELALTQPLPLRHLATLGHFQKMATSFTIRNYSMSQIIRTSDWISYAPITTTTWLATPASPRHSRTFVVNSTAPGWSPSSPITSTCVQSAITASPATTSPSAPIAS